MSVILRIMKFAIQMIGSVVAAAILAGCTPNPPEQQFVDDALRAVGGRSRVESLRTILIEGTGVHYNLGQDMKPAAATQQFAVTGLVRKIDVVNRRQRLEQTRTPKFAYFQGPQPQTQIQAVDGDVAFNVNPAGQPSRVAAQAEQDRRTEWYHHPITALHAATVDTTVSNVGQRQGRAQGGFTSGDTRGR